MDVSFFLSCWPWHLKYAFRSGVVVNGNSSSSSEKNEVKNNWSLNLIQTTEHFILIEIEAYSKKTR